MTDQQGDEVMSDGEVIGAVFRFILGCLVFLAFSWWFLIVFIAMLGYHIDNNVATSTPVLVSVGHQSCVKTDRGVAVGENIYTYLCQ